jgi:hypothetical protein
MIDLETLGQRFWALTSELKALTPKEMSTLTGAVRAYLAEPISIAQAEEEVKRKLETRAQRFLELARAQIYERPSSPYLKLLRAAGCEHGDLQREVQTRGVEKALEQLAGAGVYLTSAEFKGKEPVVRGRESFTFSPGDFVYSNVGPGFATQSSGTTNRPVRSFRPLAQYDKVISVAVFLSAHGLFSYTHALYDAVLPATGAVNNLVVYAKLGIPTERWFARKVSSSNVLSRWKGYLTSRLVARAAKRCPAGFPSPEIIGTNHTERIVRWIEKKRHAGKSCCITCATSNAARIARVAWDLGVSLEGTKFVVTGEPFTDAKKEAIERVGASATTRFASGFGLTIGYGCASPLHGDEVHVPQHSTAVIAQPQALGGAAAPIHPLMVTTLDRLAGMILLNVQNGDYASFEERPCGCGLDRLGWKLHLHRIRSYEKFTSEGMNYFYGDLFEILEKILPAEFGGGPGDYQLAEEEDDMGQTRLTLRVHPDVPNLDENGLLRRLQEELAKGSRANQFQARVWEDARTFRIRREVPYSSPRGKILPLHIPHLSRSGS